MTATPRPGPDEYAPSFAGYVARIADDEDVVAVLASQLNQVVARSEPVWSEQAQCTASRARSCSRPFARTPDSRRC